MKVHRSCRGGKHPNIPLGAMQLCLSFQPQEAPRKVEVLPEAERVASAWTDFLGFSHALHTAYTDLGLQAGYTLDHCDKLERLFLQMQAQIQAHIDLVAQPEYLHDQRILLQLRLLHRDLAEACVVVRGVRGLCFCGRQLTEPTGSFWQLVDCVRSLRRACQSLARITTPVVFTTPALQQASA